MLKLHIIQVKLLYKKFINLKNKVIIIFQITRQTYILFYDYHLRRKNNICIMII